MKYRCAPESTWISCEMKTNYSSWTAADTRDFILHLSLQEKSSELYVNRLPSIDIPTNSWRWVSFATLILFLVPKRKLANATFCCPIKCRQKGKYFINTEIFGILDIKYSSGDSIRIHVLSACNIFIKLSLAYL